MKAYERIIAVLAALMMLFGLLTVSVNIIFNRTGWLYKEYLCELENSVYYEYGISAEDASRVLARMMYYSTGRAKDLDVTIEEDGAEVPFFNERELSHMRDVRRLTRAILWSGAVCLVLSAAALAVLVIRKRKQALRLFAKTYLIAFIAALVLVIALAVWIVIDFDSFWTTFHVVFLDLESSTFDPAESRMIRICPAELFADFTGMLGTYAALFVGGGAVLSMIYLAYTRKKHELS
ncbi:MAG: DUF1461 domain-containing protein [Clostridiales bacterium]|nr:DUF1461 domain-containing protein [Clostridiales bacterium]